MRALIFFLTLYSRACRWLALVRCGFHYARDGVDNIVECPPFLRPL